MRATVICFGLGVIGSAVPAVAQTPARPTYADEKHSGTVNRIEAIGDSARFITTGERDGKAWDISASKKRHTEWETESGSTITLRRHASHGSPVTVLRIVDDAKGRRAEDMTRGTVYPGLSKTEVPLVATSTEAGVVIVTGGFERPEKPRGFYTIRVWDAGSTTPRAAIKVGPESTDDFGSEPDLSISPDGRWIAARTERTATLIDAASGATRPVVVTQDKNADKIEAVGFSTDSKSLVVKGLENTIHLLAVDTLKQVALVTPKTGAHTASFATHDGARIIESHGRRNVRFIDAKTGDTLLHSRGSSGNIFAVRWIGNDLVMRTSQARRGPVTYGVYKHEAGNFKLLWKKQAEGTAFASIAASTNGRCLFVAGKDRVRVLNATDGETLSTLTLFESRPTAAAVADRGRRLITGDEQGRIAITPTPERCHTTNS